MIWVTWRQFRGQAVAGLAVLAAATAYFVISGLSMHRTYAADLVSCAPQGDCSDVLDQFQHGYNSILNFTELFVLGAPALIGMFWGAPLIGRELETGTHQLAWNQSVMRTRWLAVKLAGVGLASVAAAGLLAYLTTWWAAPLDQISGSRFGGGDFSTRDIAPLGYALFAFALGTTAGLLLRRTIPAMAVTLAVFIGIQILMPTTVRPNLLPSTTVTFPVDRATANDAGGLYTSGGGAAINIAGLPVPQGAWILSAPPIEDSSGAVVPAYAHLNCFPDTDSAVPTKAEGLTPRAVLGCLAAYGLHESITYQPASHYWQLQWCETGIFVALGALLSGFCFWWIRRRQN